MKKVYIRVYLSLFSLVGHLKNPRNYVITVRIYVSTRSTSENEVYSKICLIFV